MITYLFKCCICIFRMPIEYNKSLDINFNDFNGVQNININNNKNKINYINNGNHLVITINHKGYFL